VNEGDLIMISRHNLGASLISYEPAHKWLITTAHACVESCLDQLYFTSGARIGSYLCPLSENMLTAHKVPTTSINASMTPILIGFTL